MLLSNCLHKTDGRWVTYRSIAHIQTETLWGRDRWRCGEGFRRWMTHLRNSTGRIKESTSRCDLGLTCQSGTAQCRWTKLPKHQPHDKLDISFHSAQISETRLSKIVGKKTKHGLTQKSKEFPCNPVGDKLEQTGKVSDSVQEKSLRPWVITSVQNLPSTEHLLHQQSSKDAESPKLARLQRLHLAAIWQPTQM